MGVNRKPRCSIGALASANPEPKWNKELALLMYNALYKELSGQTLTQFNKSINDGEKVALLFERVAHSLIYVEVK